MLLYHTLAKSNAKKITGLTNPTKPDHVFIGSHEAEEAFCVSMSITIKVNGGLMPQASARTSGLLHEIDRVF